MSRPAPSAPGPSVKNPKSKALARLKRPCSLLVDNELLAGKNFGLESNEIEVSVHYHTNTGRSSWRGFKLEFPLGADLEDQGFGMCHEGKQFELFLHRLRII